MLTSLKNYLLGEGFDGICIDLMPPVETQLDAVGLFEWNNTMPDINDGTNTHYIQIQVRRTTYDAAKGDCSRILRLLDSGTEEKLIWLDDDVCCICRPRRGGILLERGGSYTTFYCEVAIWTTAN